ncbi:hypothetical protein N9I35_02985 [Gammaproteobacteria bacterium]|nr:hypothetical protein [Gammaproteobacteria bacterium]
MKVKMKKMIITCNVGWVCRNILDTKVIDELAEHYEITILCNEATFKHAKKRLSKKKHIKVKRHDLKSSFIALKIKAILSATIVMRVSPKLATWMYPKSNSSKTIKFLFVWFNKALKQIYYYFCIHSSVKEQLSDLIGGTEKLLVTSPFGWEDHYIQANLDSKCRVYHLFLSWDNIYSKGYSMRANKYLVWADFMKEAVLRAHDCSINDIHTIEVPHLGGDSHDNKKSGKKNLLYSCVNGRVYPQEIELVKQIKAWFVGGLNKYYDNFIIRTHPSGPNFIFNSLEDEANSVIVSHPSKVKENSLYYWTPDENELNDLSELISSSITNINVASTMSIDCASHNCSIINIAFHEDQDIDLQVKQFYDFEHYSNLVNLDLVKLVFNTDELKAEIIRVAEDSESNPTLSIFNKIFDNRNNSFNKLLMALRD